MAIAFVQSKSVDGGSVTSANLAFTSNVTAGSLLVIAARIGANGRTITISDSKSNTYATVWTTLSDGLGDDSAASYAMNAASGATTVTVAISGAAATIRFAIHEYSGIATTGALDQQTRQTYASTTTPNSGNVTTTQADELLWGYDEEGLGGFAGFTAGASYTARETLAVASDLKLGTEDRIVAATGTYSASATLGGSGSGVIGIATFKAAAAGGATTRGTPFGHRGTAFNGGRTFHGILNRAPLGLLLPERRIIVPQWRKAA